MDKDDKKPTTSVSPDAWQKGVEEGLQDPNEERKGRLKEAIREHAKAHRKTVRARRAR
jgi:hypothetical protein